MATLLSAHRDLADPAHRAEVAALWGLDEVPAAPGKTALEMFEAAADGQIKLLWIVCTNPAQSLPDQATVRRAFERAEFVVVQEAFATTETTRFADLLLPASTWGEKDGTVTSSERRISRQRRFRAPPGEARADWWAFAEVGRRMGWRAAFAWDRPAAVFREHAALSGFENAGGRVFDIGGLAALGDAEYDALAPVRWPLPAGARAEGGRIPAQTEEIDDGATVTVGSLKGRVIGIPAHTNGHVAYYFPQLEAVFTGDTLFIAGCGRVFEGRANTMVESLAKLAALPDSTRVYCGHEYTTKNLQFALTLEPNNAALKAKHEWAVKARAAGQFTVPSTIGDEKRINPFLRTGSAELRGSIRKIEPSIGDDPIAIFATARALKDKF
jgi:hydroxyacylglutathione hydrolase